jgi:hypothetical protein
MRKFFLMKSSPQDRMLLERLGASRFSAEGFMGADRRSVSEIVAEDAQTLERLGVSAEAVAARLRRVDQQARAALGVPIAVAPGIEARHCEAMGRVPSPFRGDGVFPKGETRIVWNDGRQLRVTALGIALIERHGFFQGCGAPYRIEPELAAALPTEGTPASL